MMTRSRLVLVALLAFLSLFAAGCGPFSVQALPDRVQAGKESWIVVGLTSGKVDGLDVTYEVTQGLACGDVESKTAKTGPHGEAMAKFKGNDVPATCRATIQVTANGQSVKSTVTVLPATPEIVSIEPVTALAIILIASFAIDRLVTILMLFLGPVLVGAPGGEERKGREKVIYILFAAVFGLLLGYFGDIRLLEGLGFSKNVAMNVVLTALILTAGSDSISGLMKKMDRGALPEPEAKPLVIQGDLTLQRPSRPKPPQAD